MDKKRMMPALFATAGAVGTLIVLVLVGIVMVYTGSFDVAATEEHTSVMRWALDTTQHTSVDRRADGVLPPERFTTEMIEAGAREYREMCQHCHAGPGAERAEWASGMRRRPPHLAGAATEWQLEEVFWLAKHGIKMTGMPAFGPTHRDETLWNVAAFVKALPAMAPEEYAVLGDTHGAGHSHDEDAR